MVYFIRDEATQLIKIGIRCLQFAVATENVTVRFTVIIEADERIVHSSLAAMQWLNGANCPIRKPFPEKHLRPGGNSRRGFGRIILTPEVRAWPARDC
jgi:hypothetical protein